MMLGRLKNWRRRRADLVALEAMSEDGRGALARDLGVAPSALPGLAVSDAREELPELLQALELDPDELRRGDPALVRDLEGTCACCASRRTCRRALEAGDAALTYGSYCPNAPTFDALLRNEHAG